MTTKQFFFGVVIGGVVGAGLALLYAPQKGSDTRKTISDAAGTVGDRVTGFAVGVKDKVHDTAVAIKQAI